MKKIDYSTGLKFAWNCDGTIIVDWQDYYFHAATKASTQSSNPTVKQQDDKRSHAVPPLITCARV